MANSSFEEKLGSNKFVVTTEVGPPKSVDISEMVHHIELLKDKVDAINITDHQSSVMRFPSLGGALLVKELGGEPILQMTCRDRNRLALQADLLMAYSRGITNVLCLTGDSVDVGDHKEAKPVFDLDSVQLLKMIRTLESGTDMGGNELKAAPRFCIGATVHPEADFVEPQLVKFDKKVAAGAQFFQTQAIYEMHLFEKFLKASSHLKTTIIAGIVLLKSAGMARYMNKNVAGVFVPEELIHEMEQTKDKSAKSIEIAARLIKELKPVCQGVHVMPIGWDKKVPLVLDSAGL